MAAIVVVAECLIFVTYLLQVGAVLVFVPGWEQISKLNKNIESRQFFRSGKYRVINFIYFVNIGVRADFDHCQNVFCQCSITELTCTSLLSSNLC